jgi:3-hydroxybutyryl-CoA dehydrogenase
MAENVIEKVLIVGAGTMGLQIGVQCAASGFDVTVYDAYDESLTRAKARVARLAEQLAEHNRFEKQKVSEALKKLHFTSDPEKAGRDADLINESVPENPGLKAKVFGEFNRICPHETIFTTNTSTLVPSMIAADTGRPDRFMALHFYDLEVTNVVDIMPHPGTSEKTLEAVRIFCRDINHFAIELKKEQPGYIFNTMLSEWMAAALTLVSKGVANVQDVDRAWMGIIKGRSGPFAIMDSIGLETVYTVTNYWAEKKDDPRGRKNAAFLKEYVDRGELGKKTGKGFYSYPDPEFLSTDFLEGIQ